MTLIQAALLSGAGRPFSFEVLELDGIRPDEIRVRIVAAGLCHTDLAVMHGHIPVPFPIVLGHEGAGIVEEVGSAVAGFAVGDRVALSFAACGVCANCRTGRPAYCLRFRPCNFGGVRDDGTTTLATQAGETVHGNFFGQSSFATQTVVAARNAVRVPDDVPLELVAPIGCGIQTGAGAVLTTLRPQPGSSIAVAGVGAVGLSALLAARVAGATTIIAVDVLNERLAMAEQLGATQVIDGRAGRTAEQIMEITGGGVEYAVDTTAVPAVVTDLISATRYGGSVALLGVGRPDAVIPLRLATGRSLLGVMEGGVVPSDFIPRIVAMYRASAFPLDRLVTTYPFDRLDDAIAATASGAAVKAVLMMPGSEEPGPS